MYPKWLIPSIGKAAKDTDLPVHLTANVPPHQHCAPLWSSAHRKLTSIARRRLFCLAARAATAVTMRSSSSSEGAAQHQHLTTSCCNSCAKHLYSIHVCIVLYHAGAARRTQMHADGDQVRILPIGFRSPVWDSQAQPLDAARPSMIKMRDL